MAFLFYIKFIWEEDENGHRTVNISGTSCGHIE